MYICNIPDDIIYYMYIDIYCMIIYDYLFCKYFWSYQIGLFETGRYLPKMALQRRKV